MFGRQKDKPAQSRIQIRDTLFGDMPWSKWMATSPKARSVEPWVSFGRAKQLVDNGKNQDAAELLLHIVAMPDLESRHYLQAWHFLRNIGIAPSDEKENELLGVVIEVGMPQGLDLVAAYADHHARYYNYSGSGVVWERPNNSFDTAIDELLRVGSDAKRWIGPRKGVRPSAPPNGHGRINLLSATGLHFGQGELNALSRDLLVGPVIATAFGLMQDLIAFDRR